MVTVEKGPQIILFYQNNIVLYLLWILHFWIIVWFLSWFKSFTWFYFNSFSVIKQWISLIYFYVYMIRQWTNCDGLWLRVRVVLSQFISSNFIWILFFRFFFLLAASLFCFDVDFCYLSLSLIVFCTSVHFFIFISSQQRAMIKVCIHILQFCCLYTQNSEQILFAYKYQQYSRGWWQKWYIPSKWM